MKKQIGILLSLVLALFSSCREKMPTFHVIAFEDDQTTAINITSTGVELQCVIKDLESGDLTKEGRWGFEYTDNPEAFEKGLSRSFVDMKEGYYWGAAPAAGKYAAILSDLTPGKTYYYAPCLGSMRGAVHTFTTLGPKSITVVTGGVTGITTSSASCAGSCTLNNGAELQEAGILVHTSSTMTYYTYTKRYVGYSTTINANITDLNSNTTYYYCAYAKDKEGKIYYGAVKNFLTQAYKATLSDFIGTYSVKFDFATCSPGYGSPNREWSYNQTGTLVIKQITKPAGASGSWVTMILKSNSSYDYCQMNGIYDPTTYTIELFGDVAGANMTPVIGSNYSWSLCADCGVWSGSNMGTANMPCYSYGTTGYLLSNGTGYQGTVPMRLSKSNAGAMVALSAVSTDLTYGYTPNGIGHYWGGASDTKFGYLVYVDEFLNITFTSKTSNTPQDLGVGNTTLYNPNPTYTLDNYVGTYDMTFYDPWYSGGACNYTWGGVEVGKLQNDGEVYVTNLPFMNKSAFGRWDAASQSIILESNVYFPSEVFVHNTTGINIRPVFEPVYYSRTEDKAYWNRESGGKAYIRLQMQPDGSLAMVAPDNVGSSGNYSNAFVWCYYNHDTNEYLGNSDVVVEPTMTRTSAAPARGNIGKNVQTPKLHQGSITAMPSTNNYR